jgi:HK97 family phage portal protein
VPVVAGPQVQLHNGDPDNPLWWTGVLGQAVHIPANLTRGLSIIINPLVRLPWVFSKGDTPTWCVDPMLFNGAYPGTGAPARAKLWRESRFDFWARWLRDTIVYGMGLLSYEPDSEGQPLTGSLIRHDPRSLGVPIDDFHEDWTIGWNGYQYDVDEDGGFGPGRRLHFLRGHAGGVLGQHALELAAANGISTYASTLFDGAVPSGVLTSDLPLSQAQADATRDAWERMQYRRRIAVLGNGVKYQQVVMSPVDAAVGSMMLLSNTQVAHMLELPAWMLDGQSGTSMTYSNINDQRQDFVDGTLAAWSARVEESISALLPWGQTMRIDFTEYRKPTMTVATGAAQNIAQEVRGAPDPA